MGRLFCGCSRFRRCLGAVTFQVNCVRIKLRREDVLCVARLEAGAFFVFVLGIPRVKCFVTSHWACG